MIDDNKTKEQLLKELNTLRQRVAELEASKNQLTQYEEILKVFRTNMPIGLFIIQDGRFKFVNDNLRTLLADVSDEIIESYSMKLVYPDDRERVRDSAIKILRGESVKPYKYRIIDKEGQIRWLLESVSSIQYQGKRAILGHAMDITEQEWQRKNWKRLTKKNAGCGRNCKLKCSAGWNLPGL
jgi:PAS domain S-box-containing protein